MYSVCKKLMESFKKFNYSLPWRFTNKNRNNLVFFFEICSNIIVSLIYSITLEVYPQIINRKIFYYLTAFSVSFRLLRWPFCAMSLFIRTVASKSFSTKTFCRFWKTSWERRTTLRRRPSFCRWSGLWRTTTTEPRSCFNSPEWPSEFGRSATEERWREDRLVPNGRMTWWKPSKMFWW